MYGHCSCFWSCCLWSWKFKILWWGHQCQIELKDKWLLITKLLWLRSWSPQNIHKDYEIPSMHAWTHLCGNHWANSNCCLHVWEGKSLNLSAVQFTSTISMLKANPFMKQSGSHLSFKLITSIWHWWPHHKILNFHDQRQRDWKQLQWPYMHRCVPTCSRFISLLGCVVDSKI